jgi:hypothetical protein
MTVTRLWTQCPTVEAPVAVRISCIQTGSTSAVAYPAGAEGEGAGTACQKLIRLGLSLTGWKKGRFCYILPFTFLEITVHSNVIL